MGKIHLEDFHRRSLVIVVEYVPPKSMLTVHVNPSLQPTCLVNTGDLT